MKIVLYVHRRPELIEKKLRSLESVSVVRVRSPAELAREIIEADGLIVNDGLYSGEVAAAVQEFGARLKWIQVAAAGYDQLVRFGVPADVTVTNAADVFGPTVAEHAISLLLALVRHLHKAERNRVARVYSRAEMADAVGSLEGRTLLVVGFGSIGQEAAKRARAFGMRIVGISRRGTPSKHADLVAPAVELRRWLPQSDALLLSLPLSDGTRHLIGAEELALTKPGAIVVNVSRGGVVDQAALVEALQAGHLGGAGLDVFEEEPLDPQDVLWSQENVILTPHVGGNSPASRERLATLIAENARRLLRGEPPVHRLDPGLFTYAVGSNG